MLVGGRVDAAPRLGIFSDVQEVVEEYAELVAKGWVRGDGCSGIEGHGGGWLCRVRLRLDRQDKTSMLVLISFAHV